MSNSAWNTIGTSDIRKLATAITGILLVVTVGLAYGLNVIQTTASDSLRMEVAGRQRVLVERLALKALAGPDSAAVEGDVRRLRSVTETLLNGGPVGNVLHAEQVENIVAVPSGPGREALLEFRIESEALISLAQAYRSEGVGTPGDSGNAQVQQARERSLAASHSVLQQLTATAGARQPPSRASTGFCMSSSSPRASWPSSARGGAS